MKRYLAAEYVAIDGQGHRFIKRYLCVEEPEPVATLSQTTLREQASETSAVMHAMISLAILGVFLAPFVL